VGFFLHSDPSLAHASYFSYFALFFIRFSISPLLNPRMISFHCFFSIPKFSPLLGKTTTSLFTSPTIYFISHSFSLFLTSYSVIHLCLFRESSLIFIFHSSLSPCPFDSEKFHACKLLATSILNGSSVFSSLVVLTKLIPYFRSRMKGYSF